MISPLNLYYLHLLITLNSNPPKYQPFSCHGQWTVDYDVQMGGGQDVPGWWAEKGLRFFVKSLQFISYHLSN